MLKFITFRWNNDKKYNNLIKYLTSFIIKLMAIILKIFLIKAYVLK
jgi:hypothetical protein